LSPVPSTIYATLVDPNWHRTMEEEFAAAPWKKNLLP
jgi:hypothetical protein